MRVHLADRHWLTQVLVTTGLIAVIVLELAHPTLVLFTIGDAAIKGPQGVGFLTSLLWIWGP